MGGWWLVSMLVRWVGWLVVCDGIEMVVVMMTNTYDYNDDHGGCNNIYLCVVCVVCVMFVDVRVILLHCIVNNIFVVSVGVLCLILMYYFQDTSYTYIYNWQQWQLYSGIPSTSSTQIQVSRF